MVRLALGPLILTGLFLAGSLHASSARAETIDLTSQPGFTMKTVDWLEDGSTLKLRVCPAYFLIFKKAVSSPDEANGLS